MEWNARTEALYGKEGVEKLRRAHVLLFGLGGVGGYAAEALARSGVGALDLVDGDTVSLTDLNRQIFALHSTLGLDKVKAAAARLADIVPDCNVVGYKLFFLPENADTLDFSRYDYVVDAVDTVTAKLCIAEKAAKAGVPLISAMGAGNKINAAGFRVADIFETSVCPLARTMRRELKKRGIEHLKVVFSEEEPHPFTRPVQDGKPVPASNAFVPAVAGLILAGEVVNDLVGANGEAK